MSVKDTSLIILWLAIVLVSGMACYKVYVMDANYPLVTFAPCDPAQDACFSLVCDEESETYDEYLCQGVAQGEERHSAYIKKSMRSVETCDARHEDCKPLRCESREFGCEYITCDEVSLSQYAYSGVTCENMATIPKKETSLPEVEDSSVLEDKSISEPIIPTQSESEAASATEEETLPPLTPTPVEEVPTEPAPAIDQPTPEELPEPSHNLPI